MLKISNINKRYVLPIIAAGALGLSSCQSQYSKAKEYCYHNNKTQKEFVELFSSDKYTQAKLDSMVYRDLFNQTYMANDSTAVAEFNKIATEYNVKKKTFISDIVENDISMKVYDQILAASNPSTRQFIVDKYAYGNFFEKQGLMNGDLANKFEIFSKFLSPKMNYTYGNIQSDLK